MKMKLVEGDGGLYERNDDSEATADIVLRSQGGKVHFFCGKREGFNGLSANLLFVWLTF